MGFQNFELSFKNAEESYYKALVQCNQAQTEVEQLQGEVDSLQSKVNKIFNESITNPNKIADWTNSTMELAEAEEKLKNSKQKFENSLQALLAEHETKIRLHMQVLTQDVEKSNPNKTKAEKKRLLEEKIDRIILDKIEESSKVTHFGYKSIAEKRKETEISYQKTRYKELGLLACQEYESSTELNIPPAEWGVEDTSKEDDSISLKPSTFKNLKVTVPKSEDDLLKELLDLYRSIKNDLENEEDLNDIRKVAPFVSKLEKIKNDIELTINLNDIINKNMDLSEYPKIKEIKDLYLTISWLLGI